MEAEINSIVREGVEMTFWVGFVAGILFGLLIYLIT